jgi:uracil-DNA glycosylase family 4
LTSLQILENKITECTLCPRLVEYRQAVAREKRRAYRDWTYWGRPVPAFGDPHGKVLIVGLAPAAHGANRTGRMFTGDRSGDFLYRALYQTGFASQPHSVSAGDGLTLSGVLISAAVRCAPPDNKPSPEEIRTCLPYLANEIQLMENLKIVVALGKLAFDAYLAILKNEQRIKRRSAFTFGHDVEQDLGPDLPALVSSYHPSQQNTSTGKLTEAMLRAVFERVKRLVEPL